MLLAVGIVSVHGLTQKQIEEQEITENPLQSMNKSVQLEEVVLNDYVDNTTAHSVGDLLYRKFSSGVKLEKGMNIFVERGQITSIIVVSVVPKQTMWDMIPYEAGMLVCERKNEL